MKNSLRLDKCVLLICLLIVQISWSQTVFGKWKTIDDRNGITKAIVEVYEENGLLQAKVLKVVEKGKENALCIKCKGELKDKPVNGMQIMFNFKKNNKGEYRGNKLFDPEQAMTFRGRVWLDPKNTNRLKVRGYLAFLYRTQTWHRLVEE
ncbi:DUF2147 domain-containing protein [Flagellimonas sp. CMM7]|uniref:DUF2147 domain-containing protein n=1 Tax=Flagellimonas sp. CMM7 TaxID=2654676 RepID=UPI0013D5F546|nr:DUF2147 domain-containing protein [Flagellimonas sp. CMM7]UII79206.1 DUF2147 domain-containing protein [Flagellimonas sp. CMM7]